MDSHRVDVAHVAAAAHVPHPSPWKFKLMYVIDCSSNELRGEDAAAALPQPRAEDDRSPYRVVLAPAVGVTTANRSPGRTRRTIR